MVPSASYGFSRVLAGGGSGNITSMAAATTPPNSY